MRFYVANVSRIQLYAASNTSDCGIFRSLNFMIMSRERLVSPINFFGIV